MILKCLYLLTLSFASADELVYYKFPHFWTSVGFCPAGEVGTKDISRNLLSEAVKMNMRQIAALPNRAVTHIRIHWLLDLLQFVQYTQAGVPIFDFTQLDEFIDYLDDIDVAPIFEFMANPGNIFLQNPQRNAFIWENLAIQVVNRYQDRLGTTKFAQWYFESWNEPDLSKYNLLNFTTTDHLEYMQATRSGLQKAARQPAKLIGPAGLFKMDKKHPLCWHILDYCNTHLDKCPIDVLSFHRKGEGSSEDVIDGTLTLIQQIYQHFPALKRLPLVNSEADPIAIWSQPRPFQSDVRYAVILLNIVLDHWDAKVNGSLLQNLKLLSHDNAFLSYHPHEFTQRTLLAHFRMNNTQPPHSQFIQKPVYASLGLLSKLGTYSTKSSPLPLSQNLSIKMIKTATRGDKTDEIYWAILLVPSSDNFCESDMQNYKMDLTLDTPWAYIFETLESEITDPAYVWMLHQSPAYPNATLRESMRRSQTPKLVRHGRVKRRRQFILDFSQMHSPWVLLVRFCSSTWPALQAPTHMSATPVTQGEVLLDWREQNNSTECLRTYEVWYRYSVEEDWSLISRGWHLPFPSFQFAPSDQIVSGFYKVRGIDLFNKIGPYSEVYEYYEV